MMHCAGKSAFSSFIHRARICPLYLVFFVSDAVFDSCLSEWVASLSCEVDWPRWPRNGKYYKGSFFFLCNSFPSLCNFSPSSFPWEGKIERNDVTLKLLSFSFLRQNAERSLDSAGLEKEAKKIWGVFFFVRYWDQLVVHLSLSLLIRKATVELSRALKCRLGLLFLLRGDKLPT